ncbi:uncharacterized protein Z519_08694 [Cladophialophora bantiana CBS 173.52]|uniref:Aldehyde dehydrogenase domain-containing protein n=1 Tax=Cladophialophora bantiana (strain ATCC 10958 / CBS 173.52 / CDC B-1940 / NIH 8579) TaxID=1442370 RepID=A0A0D2ELQ6_CLAB1|nr:uncharacterized protein Z519_08694 [Cladophialophora bantiana CBS 173.52]KIW90911.1 hypothetical protein Z519_08694 [Cladophialophora bantiana CBS 173.52]
MASVKTLPLIIDNKAVSPAGPAVVTNTSSYLKTDYVRYVSATPEDAVAAVESAQTAFRSWSQSLPRMRRTILEKTATLIRENEAELINFSFRGDALAVYTVDNDEEAIELANSTKYGLSAGVYSRDIARAMKVASRIEVGQTHVNFPMGTGWDEATLSVGLTKASGWAKQNGSYGLDEFLELRTITVTDPVEFAAGMAQMAQ